MKLNLTILLLAFSLALNAAINISGNWEGYYFTETGHKYSLKLSFHQVNDSIFGTATTNEQAYTLNGKILSTQDSLIVEARHTTSGRLYFAYAGILNTDSIRFVYYSVDSSYYGYGAIKRVSQTRTLKLHYNYTGKHQLSDSIPLNIGLYATPEIESASFYEVPVVQKSGTLFLTGIDSSIFYLMLYAGYNYDANRFIDMPVSYKLYNMPAPEQFWDSIVINDGEVKEIDISFDDSNLYPQPAQFKGGKLPYIRSVSVDYVPYSVANDSKGNVYVSDQDYIFKYTANMADFVDTLRDAAGKPIEASKICFGPRNTFYVLTSSGVKFYNNSGAIISAYTNYASHGDIALAADSNLIYCNYTKVVKFKDSLTSPIEITISQIIADHATASTDGEIWSVAGKKNGDIAISVDYDDEEGTDAVVFYNNDLSTYKSQIGGDWLNNGPHNIAFDTLGRTYILNYYHDELISIDLDSKPFQASYYKDKPGKYNGAMQSPADLAIFGPNIYVAEDDNKRVSIFSYKCRIEKFDTIAICQGDLYKGHSASGSFVEFFESTDGCDTIVTTYLTVNPVYSKEESISICQGENYLGETNTGNYTYNYKSMCGCDSIIKINLTVKALPVTPVISSTGMTINSDALAGNQWYSVEKGIIKDSVNQHLYASEDGSYFVRVTAGGCLSDSSNVIHVSKTSVEVVKNNNVELFPMPVEQYLNINSESIIDKIEIYSISGQKQLLKSNIGQSTFSCDLANLKSGVYTISLFFKDSKNPEIRKFIKK